MSEIFGLDEQIARELTDAITPAGADPDGWRDRFARVVWGVIAEPGDVDAGAVRDAVGAEAALKLLVSRNLQLTRTSLSPAQLDAATYRWAPRISSEAVVKALQTAAQHRLVCTTQADWWYPPAIADLGDGRPAALWVAGDARTLAAAGTGVTITGSRAATGYGEHVAAEFAGTLTDNGMVVVAGGSYGIDAVTHRAAANLQGRTIAVLSGGLDRPYPSAHEGLFARIAEVGAVVSAQPPGAPPTRSRMEHRNRLLAAITPATIIVEAGARSGSLAVALHAADLGRRVGAVPGPITSAASAGCHQLLRDRVATLVASDVDVLEFASGHRTEPAPSTAQNTDLAADIDATRVVSRSVRQQFDAPPGPGCAPEIGR